jgi:hypothetical protein
LASSFEPALMHFARDEVGSNVHARQTDVALRDRRDRLRRRRDGIVADVSDCSNDDRCPLPENRTRML